MLLAAIFFPNVNEQIRCKSNNVNGNSKRIGQNNWEKKCNITSAFYDERELLFSQRRIWRREHDLCFCTSFFNLNEVEMWSSISFALASNSQIQVSHLFAREFIDKCSARIDKCINISWLDKFPSVSILAKLAFWMRAHTLKHTHIHALVLKSILSRSINWNFDRK